MNSWLTTLKFIILMTKGRQTHLSLLPFINLMKTRRQESCHRSVPSYDEVSSSLFFSSIPFIKLISSCESLSFQSVPLEFPWKTSGELHSFPGESLSFPGEEDTLIMMILGGYVSSCLASQLHFFPLLLSSLFSSFFNLFSYFLLFVFCRWLSLFICHVMSPVVVFVSLCLSPPNVLVVEVLTPVLGFFIISSHL